MKVRVFAVVLAGASVVCANAQFVNGNFETGDLSGWTVGLTPIGATAVQDAFQYDIDGPGPLGTNFVGRFSVGRATTSTAEEGITLTQSMNLDSGTSYTFTFDWSAWRTVTTSNTQGGIFSLIVDGTIVATQSAGSTSSTAPKYGTVSGVYLATSTGPHSIGALITRPFTIPTPTAPTLFQGVDNFTVAPVPEPGTMAVVGLGLAALLKRKRK